MIANEVSSYKVCEICLMRIVKFNRFNCRKCQFNSNATKTSVSKVYKMKFNKNLSTLSDVLNVTQKYIGK
jgi:hypothetical protein